LDATLANCGMGPLPSRLLPEQLSLGGSDPVYIITAVADHSRIEWTHATWNPVTGCDKVSPGCAHCYAETFAERFRAVPNHPYEQGFDLKLWPARLSIPLTWKRPRLIFVNSMSDLFHEDIPFTFVQSIFRTIRQAEWHTFQILTKRADRLAELAPLLDWPPMSGSGCRGFKSR